MSFQELENAVESLMESRADVNVVNNDHETALTCAAERGNVDGILFSGNLLIT